jgi:hypothetical protein
MSSTIRRSVPEWRVFVLVDTRSARGRGIGVTRVVVGAGVEIAALAA